MTTLEANKETLSMRGYDCSIPFINGTGEDLEVKTPIPVGGHTFFVHHDTVCKLSDDYSASLSEGEMQHDGPGVGSYDVELDAPLALDMLFGDTYYGPLGQKYIVVGTPFKCGTLNGVAAKAGAECIRVITSCECREAVDGCKQEATLSLDPAPNQINSVTIGTKQVTGPWTPNDFLEPVSGVKAELRKAGCQIESFAWDPTTGDVCIVGYGLGTAGANVEIDHSVV